jgi:hypothetical protein
MWEWLRWIWSASEMAWSGLDEEERRKLREK